MIVRVRYKQRGGHVHMRVFCGRQEGSLGKCGELVMRNDEFVFFRAAASFIQFRQEFNEGETRDEAQD